MIKQPAGITTAQALALVYLFLYFVLDKVSVGRVVLEVVSRQDLLYKPAGRHGSATGILILLIVNDPVCMLQFVRMGPLDSELLVGAELLHALVVTVEHHKQNAEVGESRQLMDLLYQVLLTLALNV